VSRAERQSFEKSFQRLETIVAELETGDLPLERALALFAEGMKISRSLQRQLGEAEKLVTEVVRSEEDGLGLRPFETAGGDEDES
jgi:exodeoxyribonuclease VII small subunit